MSGQLDPIRRSIFLRSSVERAFRVFTEGMSTWRPLGTHSTAVDDERESVTALGVRVEPWTGGWLLEELSTGEQLPWGEILA